MTFHGNISTKTLTNNILTITTYLNVGVIDFQTITRKMSHILKYVIGIEANFFSKNIKRRKLLPIPLNFVGPAEEFFLFRWRRRRCRRHIINV